MYEDWYCNVPGDLQSIDSTNARPLEHNMRARQKNRVDHIRCQTPSSRYTQTLGDVTAVSPHAITRVYTPHRHTRILSPFPERRFRRSFECTPGKVGASRRGCVTIDHVTIFLIFFFSIAAIVSRAVGWHCPSLHIYHSSIPYMTFCSITNLFPAVYLRLPLCGLDQLVEDSAGTFVHKSCLGGSRKSLTNPSKPLGTVISLTFLSTPI